MNGSACEASRGGLVASLGRELVAGARPTCDGLRLRHAARPAHDGPGGQPYGTATQVEQHGALASVGQQLQPHRLTILRRNCKRRQGTI